MADRPEYPIDTVVLTGSGMPAGGERDLFSFAALLSIPLRHLRLLLLTPPIAAAVIVTLGILLARYVSESQFTPTTTNSSLQGLMGVAAQFGLGVGNLGNSQSVDSYGSLVQSRDLLTDAVETVYHFAAGPGERDSLTGNLLQFYRVGGKDHADSVLRAITILQKKMSVTVDETGNTVTTNVKAEWAGLAEAINRRLLDGVNTFNVEQLQSQASMERRFIEQRLRVAQSEVDSAEARLRVFLEDNRTYQNSPRLTFEEQRLQARLDLRQQVYTTLAQSYEQARIAEVRTTPVITIIDVPEGSAARHRHIVRNGFLGLIIGLIMALGLAFVREYLQKERERHPSEYSEFSRLRVAALRRLSPRRLLRGSAADPR